MKPFFGKKMSCSSIAQACSGRTPIYIDVSKEEKVSGIAKACLCFISKSGCVSGSLKGICPLTYGSVQTLQPWKPRKHSARGLFSQGSYKNIF